MLDAEVTSSAHHCIVVDDVSATGEGEGGERAQARMWRGEMGGRAASSRTMARPMPRLAPVMTIVAFDWAGDIVGCGCGCGRERNGKRGAVGV